MQGMKQILVPVDGSKNSDKAVLQAASLAAVCGADIDLLYVAYFRQATDDAAGRISWLPDAVTGSIARTSQAILQHAKTLVDPKITCRTHLETGIPAKAIISFAKKNDMDLIVVGGRGLGLVEGFLHGIKSREVLEQAHCPVLVVK